MKKRDLKKLALLGITGGIMMVSQPVHAEDVSEIVDGHTLAFGGCSSCRTLADNGCASSTNRGGRHGCGTVADNGCASSPSRGGSHGCGSVADNGCASSPSRGGNYGGSSSHGCGSIADNYQPTSGCGGKHGCGGSGSGDYYDNGYSTQGQGRNSCASSPSQQSNNYYQPQQQQSNQQSYNNRNGRYYTADAATAEKTAAPAAPAHTLSKEELRAQLSDQGKTIFDRLSPEGQALAIKLASQSCKGHNDCKGQNSCKSDKNACAGQGGCKGQSNCSFKDKDKAVKVAALKMAEKRASLNNGAGK